MGRGNVAMSPLEQHLKAYMEHSHIGHENAITSRELCEMYNVRDWPLRVAIRELIRQGVPIAAATGGPAGYFIVRTRAEAERYAGTIRSRLIEDAIRRRDFRRAADQYLTPAVQLELLA